MDNNTFNPSVDVGLTSAQVEKQFERGLYNKQPKSQTKTVGQIIKDNTLTLFNFLNIILAIMVIAVGSYKNALFINIVIINTVIGIIQEIKAKKIIDQLSLISQPHTQVIRDGKEEEIEIDKIVLSDILILTAGKQIPSDARVVSGEIEVNESLLTGEADSIIKKVGDTLLSGSFVVAGQAYVRVDKIGNDNYASKITLDAKKARKPNSEIMRAMNLIMKVIGFTILPIGVFLLIGQMTIENSSFYQSVISTVAALIGMIPEGLVLLTSIALAVGVIRLGRYKTLVQELYCIETLARVDVLCLDKTGTITEGVMEVKSIDLINNIKDPAKALRALVNTLKDDNSTFLAIKDSFSGERPKWNATKIVPFSSARKWSGANFGSEGTYIMGAPEFILGDDYDQYKDKIEGYASQGNRVLMLGYSDETFEGENELPQKITVIALLLLADKIRKEAKKTLEYFASQGVEIKVISGDNPLTVAEVAGRAGLNNASHFVDATTLKTDDDVIEASGQYTVFGRVTPGQKRVLVNALKSAGHTVAMTGDGVNDVLALRDSDCSIAMASGSDAARQVSQLVLLDSNFSSLTKVLMEGRRVINNISRAASLFLVKTIFSFLLAVIVIMANEGYPFIPIQLTLISTVSIGIPSFFLALEPNKSRMSGNFLEKVLRKALPGALTIVLNIVVAMIIGGLIQLSNEEISTMACLLTGVAGLIILYGVCQPMNIQRNILFWSMTIIFAIAIVFFPEFFYVIPFFSMNLTSNLDLILVLLPMMFLIYPVMLLFRKFITVAERFLITHKILNLKKHTL
ncbi:MAG: cation-translocating P-type ATPase [Eubacterium sp.]